MARWNGLVAWVVALAAAASMGLGGEAAKDKAKTPPKPATHTVTRGPFTIEVNTKGVFEAERMAEVVFRPEAWADLLVHEAVPSGTRVAKGQVVLELDTRKIDETLVETEAACRLGELALRLAREELDALERTTPLDAEVARRAKQQADQDLKLYKTIDRPLSVETALFGLKRAEQTLLYNREELRQLEKMYKADDLTEETEEIVLTRQRNAVERAEFYLKTAKIQTDKALKVELPRKDIAMDEGVARKAIAAAKARVALPLALAKARLGLDKQKHDHAKARERLAKLKQDRGSMIARAPADGIVYYGPCVAGNWPKLASSLRRGAKVAPTDVVMNNVQPRPLLVRATVEEKQLQHLRPGQDGEAVPVGFPDQTLRGKVRAISLIPVAPGKFGLTLSVDVGKGAERLVPGMSCSATIAIHRSKDVLTVPASAVFTEGPARRTVVYVRTKAGGHEARPVAVGRKTDKTAVILRGLKEGEVVLLQLPKT